MEPPKGPPADGWVKKTGSIHKMECYSTFKEKKALPHVTMCRNPEDVMLSEISRTQKKQICQDPTSPGTPGRSGRFPPGTTAIERISQVSPITCCSAGMISVYTRLESIKCATVLSKNKMCGP